MKTKIIFNLTVLFITTFFLAGRSAGSDEQDFIRQREMMVSNQIEARGIKDKRLLFALRKVKRHLFVPQMYRLQAYQDYPLPIGEGQTISQPYIVALMTELLALKGDEKVLEIGTGSGYQAAILAELSREVYTIEILESLARKAEKLLKELGYANIYVKCGDGFLGWPDKGPFDAIMVTCAPDEIPPALIEQLKEGGRLVIPVGTHWQELKLVSKIEGRIITQNIIPVRFVPMIKGDRMMAKTNQIQLPEITTKGKTSLEEAILKRRSQRDFRAKDLSLEQISQLLWAGQGITEEKHGYSFRAAPSAGALYPIEIYALTRDGLFHYQAKGHKLEVIAQEDLRKKLSLAALGQSAVTEAPLNIVICAVYSRVTQKYGERGIRYAHIEAGHVAQNIHLQAVALGLGSVPIGAFSDEEVKKILSCLKDCQPLYIIPVGYAQ